MQRIYYSHLKLLLSSNNCTFNNSVGCYNDCSWPQDGTVALPVNPQGPSCLISSKNFEEVSDSPKETMKDKVVKAWAEAIKRKYDCKRAGVVILFPVIHIYWAKGEWWLSGDCSTSVALQMNEDANGGRGKLKPLVTLSTPRRPWCRTLSLSTSRTQPLCLSIPSARAASRPSTFSSRQTLDSLCCVEPYDKRQMCPPQRIQFDKLLLHKLLNNPEKPPE